MKSLNFLFLFLIFFVLACNQPSLNEPIFDESSEYNYINCENWAVQYNVFNESFVNIRLSFEDFDEFWQVNSIDSLNFNSPLSDSIRINKRWNLGGASLLLFSISFSADVSNQTLSSIKSICENAFLVNPPGLRRIHLSDRLGSIIQSERSSLAVEPPPSVTHHLLIYYQDYPNQNILDNNFSENEFDARDLEFQELEVIDSMVVNFRGSNSDSLSFVFINRDESTVISSTTGFFRRADSLNNYNCVADSTGLYIGIFQNRFSLNIPYLDSRGRIRAQARLTSAFLSGDAYYPLSNTSANYIVRFFLPPDFTAWTPLDFKKENNIEYMVSRPGGIVGGLPIAIGIYNDKQLAPRYRAFSFSGSVMLPTDSTVIHRIVELLVNTIDFPLAEFSFVEINNPDHSLIIPGFGGILYSEGALESLEDVSDWDNLIAEGIVPEGVEIITGAAEAILLQSLQLDPVLFNMLRAWLPLKYYEISTVDTVGLSLIRQSYLKAYLYNAEKIALNIGEVDAIEYALADQTLLDSPLKDVVSVGKGVIVLEYLNSLRMLNRLPYLLQNFMHSSSGNYWLKIISSLRIYEGTIRYDLLKALLYQPGIPQIKVSWKDIDGEVFIRMQEFQPGLSFNLEFSRCQVFLEDTVIVTELEFNESSGLYQCKTTAERVVAIDLNWQGLIPADIIYRRVTNGELE